MDVFFLFSFAFHLSSQLFVRPPQTTHFAFLHFFFLGMVLITTSYTVLHSVTPSIVIQALCQI